MQQDIEQEINAVLDSYIAAWDTMQFNELRALWNECESEIYYLAEEADQPFRQFSEVLDYWQYTESIIEWLAVSSSNRHIKQLTDELCVLSYDMHVDASMAGSKLMKLSPIGIDVRVSTILRKTQQGWRFIHYAEAPLGALPFVRRAYNANVRIKKS